MVAVTKGMSAEASRETAAGKASLEAGSRFYGAISKDKPLFLTIRGLPKSPPINELKRGASAPEVRSRAQALSEATLVRPAEQQPP